MTSHIAQKQNESLPLKQLAAMRVLYSRAKQFFAVQLILSVPIVILIALTALALDKEWFQLPRKDIAWFVGASGVLFAIMDVLFWNPQINSKREKAAKIQQCFDSAVLSLKWDEIKYGKAPDPEEIETWAKKYRHDPNVDLRDWYREEVAQLPHSVARIVCQRANCWWDMDLRRKYNATVYSVGIAFLISVFAFAIHLNVTSETFFGLVLAPLLPFLTIAPKLIQDNNDAIERLEAMKDGIDAIWARILTGDVKPDELEKFSDDIQWGIYNNRRSNPLVFDWVHRRAKPDHEDTTSKTTEQYVSEYRRAQSNG